MVRQNLQKSDRRRGSSGSWEPAGSVWSIVCAMNLGLLPETSWKDVSFVNLSVDFRRERHHPASRSPDREDVAARGKSATPSVPWPFVHATRTLTKLVRKSRRRVKHRRWTIIRRKKSKREINGTATLRRRGKTAGKVDVSATPGRNSFSLTQLRARSSSDREIGTRECPYGRYRSTGDDDDGDDEVRRATWDAEDREEIARIDRAVGSTYSELCSSRRRGRLPSEYLANLLRVGDDVEDVWRDCDDDVESEMESTSLAERLSRVNGAYAPFARKSVCRSTRSGDTARRKRKNGQLESHGNHFVKDKGEVRARGREHRAAATTSNRERSRVSLEPRTNSSGRESGSKNRDVVVAVDARDSPGKMHKCRDYDAPRSSHDLADVSRACKVNATSTATAIMRDIQAQIRNTEIPESENILSEVRRTDDSREKREEGALARDVSMEYDWVYEDGFGKEDNSHQSTKRSSASGDPRESSTSVNHANRRYRKKKSSAFSIDCGSVDKTETTYQGVFHECVDFDSSRSTSCLKINVDENRGLEDDAGTSSSWPRSSLTEENDNDEFDSSLLTSLRAVSDDERTLASMCYKYQNETSDDATKNMITYVNKKRNSGKSSLTNHRFVSTDDCVKVESKTTRGTADRNKMDLSRRSASDRDNNTECDTDGTKEYAARRMTRASMKTTSKSCIGKLVWGYCSGWWPALIVDATHVGMASESGKLWVYWIGESQISLLNEKTQIEPFSRKLEDRLTQKLRKNSRSQAIDETIQMLRQRYDCTLTKPYHSWIRRNIPTSEELDNLNFYPYSDKIQEKLDILKEQNAKATERYILNQRNSPETPKKQIIEKSKDNTKIMKQIEEERLSLKEQYPGVIVWAKITGHNWWPAMIIDYRDCCFKEPSFGCQWIMWYGDYTVSQVHHLAFLKFDKGIEKMRDYIENTKKHLYLVGVLQASKDYCSRLGCNTDNWSLDNVFKYFSDMNTHVPYNCLQVSESNKIYDKYSDEIVKKINELKADTNVDDKRKNDIEKSDALLRVTLGESTIEKLCLKCLKFPKDEVEEHPFFIGSLCKDCSNLFKPCMFVFGNDDKCFYCTVCAATGTVVICDKEDCVRVYCTACLKFLLCPKAYDDMLLEDPWECFLCRDESRLPTNGLLRPRLDWKEKITGMFRTVSNQVSDDQINCSEKKRGVRVLSLFDGLSTGLLVLSKLGIVVDVYYASEIDKDALMVSAAYFGDRIHHLGDVRTITKDKIKEIAPIDLLIGGSPCNDLSLVNPARLGLHDPKGTGILFFDYCRILKELKRVNKGHHLFWLYENVASMPSEYRLEINKHLGREPVVIDSADFSPQHRLRLYWHNFPYNPYFPSFHKQQDVQDILTPHCNRYSLVKKIRTVTTRKNSLRQGKSELKPIMMMGQSDTLWITELEEIFGFPKHYTDVKNLSASNRQRLIGKSWSVQTLMAILRPLCSFFKCNEDETN